eukprot:2770452-Prymnesium_polylepis.1
MLLHVCSLDTADSTFDVVFESGWLDARVCVHVRWHNFRLVGGAGPQRCHRAQPQTYRYSIWLAHREDRRRSVGCRVRMKLSRAVGVATARSSRKQKSRSP